MVMEYPSGGACLRKLFRENSGLSLFSPATQKVGTAFALCWLAKARRWSNGEPTIGD
jgi:hypothetical protein